MDQEQELVADHASTSSDQAAQDAFAKWLDAQDPVDLHEAISNGMAAARDNPDIDPQAILNTASWARMAGWHTWISELKTILENAILRHDGSIYKKYLRLRLLELVVAQAQASGSGWDSAVDEFQSLAADFQPDAITSEGTAPELHRLCLAGIEIAAAGFAEILNTVSHMLASYDAQEPNWQAARLQTEMALLRATSKHNPSADNAIEAARKIVKLLSGTPNATTDSLTSMLDDFVDIDVSTNEAGIPTEFTSFRMTTEVMRSVLPLGSASSSSDELLWRTALKAAQRLEKYNARVSDNLISAWLEMEPMVLERWSAEGKAGALVRLFWADTTSHLGSRLLNLEWVDRAREMLQGALAVPAATDEELRAAIFHGLARIEEAAYRISGDGKHLNAAVDHYDEAHTASDDSVRNPDLLSDASVTLLLRHRVNGSVTDLERAIAFGSAALGLTDVGDIARVERLRNLGVMFRHAYDIIGGERNRDQALKLYNEALSHPAITDELKESVTHALWILEHGDEMLYDVSTKQSRAEVVAKIENIGDRLLAARRTTSFAATCLTQFRIDGDRALLQDAMLALGHALCTTPPTSTESFYLLLAVGQLAEAHGDAERLLVSAFYSAATLAHDNSNTHLLEAVTRWLGIIRGRETAADLGLLAGLLSEAIMRLHITQGTLPDKLLWLSRTSGSAGTMVLRLAQTGDVFNAIKVGDRLKSVTMSERFMLSGGRPSAYGDSHSESEGYLEIARDLASALRDSPINWPDNANAVDRIHGLQKKLWSLMPGASAWERVSNFPDLTTDNVRVGLGETFLVYIAADSNGSGCVVHQGYDTWYVPLPELVTNDLRRTLVDYFGAYAQRQSGSYLRWMAVLEATCDWLGEIVLRRLAAHIPRGASVVFVPFGEFVWLPLHAARLSSGGDYEYAVDRWAIRYSPNASFAMQRALDTSPFPARGLIVDVKSAPGLRTAKYMEVEADLLGLRFPKWVRVSSAGATQEALSSELGRTNWVHFACHGQSHISDSRENYLHIGLDETLRLPDLLAMAGPAIDTVVLSACETSMPRQDAPDELWGIPGALLSSGVRRVVASQWAVDDLASLVVSHEMYRKITENGCSIGEALSAAMLSAREGHLAPDVAAALHPRDVDWVRSGGLSHPVFWAGFVSYGGP